MKQASVTLIVAANLPDIDLVTGAWGNLAYLRYHRGITHSMVGVTVLGFFLAVIVFLIQRRSWRERGASSLPPSLLNICLICWVGTWSHLLLDFTNSYGVRLFMPFRDRWFAWDIEFIIDPVLLAILTCGLILPNLFKLISEEVGVREKRTGRGGALLVLVVIPMLWLVRDVNHRSAIERLSAFTFRGQDPSAIYALPSPASPFRWNCVVETDRAYFALEVGPGFDVPRLNQAKIYYKPEDSDVLRAVRATRTAATFFDFARLPIYTIEKRGEDTVVTIRDLRFMFASRRRRGFAATILLSKELKVLNEKFSFGG